eukprot:evm.model.scf_2648.1 EVM.evm.TU.scf_2648.1   scf_2648:11109-19411(-)
MPMLAAAHGPMLALATLLLATAAPSSQARSLEMLDRPDPVYRDNDTDMFCGPHCSCLRDTSIGQSYCGDCEPGYGPLQGRISNCDVPFCAPHCVKCTSDLCLECEAGYTWASYAESKCMLDYAHVTQVNVTTTYPEVNIDYKPTFSLGFLPLTMLPCIVVWTLRRLRRRLIPDEIPMQVLVTMPPRAAPPDPRNAPGQQRDGEADDPNAESETALLVPRQARGRATKDNSVLVVGPVGDIEMGVVADCPEEPREET